MLHRYRVMAPSFINNVYHEEGAEIEFEGEVSANLQRIDPPKAHHKHPAHEEPLA